MEEIKLYEYDYEKPDLSEFTIEHYGIKGMKWGVRKDKYKKIGSRKRRQKAVKEPMTKEKALATRNLKYISEHKNQFSTQEMNELMNRINTEQRMDEMYRRSSNKAKIKKILRSNTAKTVGKVAVGAFAIAGATAYVAYKKGLPIPKVSELVKVSKEAVQRYVSNQMFRTYKDFMVAPKINLADLLTPKYPKRTLHLVNDISKLSRFARF